MRDSADTARAMWRWTTWPVSCAMTLASSASLSVIRIRPLLMQMKPPKVAKALTIGSRNAW